MKISEIDGETDEEVYGVMRELRAHLEFSEFVQRVHAARQETYRLFVARDETMRIVGVVGCREFHDLPWGYNLYVDDLVVSKTVRRRGVGRALILFVTDLARKHGCAYVRLATGLQRVQAQAFYESIGFKKTSYAYALNVTQ